MKKSEFINKLIKYSICFLLMGVGTIAIIYTKNLGSITDIKEKAVVLSDAFFVPGIIMTGIGLLVFASNHGAFDMLSYGFVSLLVLFTKNPAKRKYHTYYDYQVAKASKEKLDTHFILVSGLVFVFISIIFTFIYFA